MSFANDRSREDAAADTTAVGLFGTARSQILFNDEKRTGVDEAAQLQRVASMVPGIEYE